METSLYAPVKRFLEGLGFEVKGEVCGCDIVAVDHGSPIALVICELKLSFTLELVLQAADRSTVCDEVWLAVRGSMRGRGRESDPRVKRLCRLLGFGLLCVSRSGRVDALVEPVAWRPRPNAKRRSKILEEHRRRKGDPTPGGAARQPIMTAYRQQALECAPGAGSGAAARLEAFGAGRAENPAPQCLWLVHQGRARRLCSLGSGQGRPRFMGGGSAWPARQYARRTGKNIRANVRGRAPTLSGGDLDQVGRSSRGCAKAFSRRNNFGHRANAGSEDRKDRLDRSSKPARFLV